MPDLHLQTSFNKENTYHLFKQQGGKEKSSKEKLYLTNDQKKEHKRWCEEEKEKIEMYGVNYFACFLDEK